MISFYESQAARFIQVDKDEHGLFCTIPSEKDMGIRYRQNCVESSTGVEVLSCSCPSRKQPCKHHKIVQAFWTRIYKSARTEEKILEAPLNGNRPFVTI